MKKLFFALALGLLVVAANAASAGTYAIDVSATEVIVSGVQSESWTYPWGGWYSSWDGYYIGYYKFQLPNAPGEQISSASIQFQIAEAGFASNVPWGRMYFQWVADDNWTPGSMTWTNAPTNDYQGILDTGVYAEIGEWATWLYPADVTGLIGNEDLVLNGQYVSFAMFGADYEGPVPHDGALFAFPHAVLQLETSAVPEPGSIVTLLGGMTACLAGVLRRRK